MNVWRIAISALLVASFSVTDASAQERLGDVLPGGVLRLPLEDVLPLSRYRVDIDGQPVDVRLTLSGRWLLVTLPEGLRGAEHDIALYRKQPDTDQELGVWTFGLQAGQTDVTMTGVVDVEHRQGAAGSETRYSGYGRIGFDVDGGRFRGGLGFVQTGDARRRVDTEITDYFLETRRAAFGHDLTFRLGTQYLPTEVLLADDADWRGLSLRQTDPERRRDVLPFALKPGEASGTDNLTGIEDPDARVIGAAARVFPLAGSGFRVDALAFDGRADLPGSGPGVAQGAGLRLSGPIGQNIGDFSVDYALSGTRAPTDAKTLRGTAWQAELGFALLPEDRGDSLELRLTAARVSPEFYSPLNPDLIADEGRLKAELLYLSDEWQVRFSAAQAQSNITDDPGQPTDRFRDAALDLTYSPYIFTGGFLNGVTFYGSLYSEDQTRLHSPAGAPAPQDFRLRGLSVGMDRFQPDHAWAVGLKMDWLDDLSGGGASERRQRLEASYAYTPDDLTTLTLRGELGRRDGAAGQFDDASVEVSLAFPIVEDLWSGYVEAGATRSDAAPGDGAYFGAEVKRQLSPATALLMRADYAQGFEADALSPGRGWVFGLGLRHDFGAARR